MSGYTATKVDAYLSKLGGDLRDHGLMACAWLLVQEHVEDGRLRGPLPDLAAEAEAVGLAAGRAGHSYTPAEVFAEAVVFVTGFREMGLRLTGTLQYGGSEHRFR